MNAKTMFEKLGYKLIGTSSLFQYRKEYNDAWDRLHYEDIIFNNNLKGYITLAWYNELNDKGTFKNKSYDAIYITIELNKAIQQQIKELGWLDAKKGLEE